MALINNYVDPKISVPPGAPSYAPKLQRAFKTGTGDKVFRCITDFTIAASDAVNSIYRLFPSVPLDYIITKLVVANDAMAGTTAVDFGLYRPLAEGGAVLNGTLFSTGVTLAAAHNGLQDGIALNALTLVAQTINSTSGRANAVTKLSDLLGETFAGLNVRSGADLCMKVTTSGGVAGNLVILAEFEQG